MNSRLGPVLLIARFVDKESGNQYEMVFPNVELTVETEIEHGDRWDDGMFSYSSPAMVNSMKLEGRAFRAKNEEAIMTMRLTKRGRRKIGKIS